MTVRLSRHSGPGYDNWGVTVEAEDGSLVVSPTFRTADEAIAWSNNMEQRVPRRPDKAHTDMPIAETLDDINPDHYKFSGMETIDWMEAQAPTQSHFSYHCRMQAQKYLARAGRKRGADATTDMQKCIWWINKYLESIGKEHSTP